MEPASCLTRYLTSQFIIHQEKGDEKWDIKLMLTANCKNSYMVFSFAVFGKKGPLMMIRGKRRAQIFSSELKTLPDNSEKEQTFSNL